MAPVHSPKQDTAAQEASPESTLPSPDRRDAGPMSDLFGEIAAPGQEGVPQPDETPSPLGLDGQWRCMICEAPAHFGFDVKIRAGKLGRWSCRDHIENVKHMRL
jgi:hypothetical protein